jgi:hypothetical protein
MNEVGNYIEKQKSPQKEICIKLRKIILKNLKEPEEEMRWGVPSYKNGSLYFVSLKTHVNFGFSIKRIPKEKLSFLKGGKTMKHIEIDSINCFNEREIVDIIKFYND